MKIFCLFHWLLLLVVELILHYIIYKLVKWPKWSKSRMCFSLHTHTHRQTIFSWFKFHRFHILFIHIIMEQDRRQNKTRKKPKCLEQFIHWKKYITHTLRQIQIRHHHQWRRWWWWVYNRITFWMTYPWYSEWF